MIRTHNPWVLSLRNTCAKKTAENAATTTEASTMTVDATTTTTEASIMTVDATTTTTEASTMNVV